MVYNANTITYILSFFLPLYVSIEWILTAYDMWQVVESL